jgi:hypothetical protein
MKIHKDTPESVKMVLSAIMECGEKGAPVLACPGTYHGRPATVLAIHAPRGEQDGLFPLAVILDPETDDAAYLTILGATMQGGEAPSPAGGQADAAMAVLRDVAVASPTQFASLRERASRVLAGRPVAPAAAIHTGMYL